MTAVFQRGIRRSARGIAAPGATPDAAVPVTVVDVTGPPAEAPEGAVAAEPGRPAAESSQPVVFPAFDGLRAIAAMLVLFVHVAFYSGLTTGSAGGDYVARGEIGVEVFFLISGFLLYRPFAAAHLGGRTAPVASGFYIRRLLRIFPLYWLALAVALNVIPDERMGVHGLTGLLQTGFLMQGYRQETAIQGLTQAWTLNIEFAFYIWLPMYAWLLVRRRQRRSARAQLRIELAALFVIFAASRVLHYALIGSDIWWADGWTVWLPVWWDLFAMGMLLAVLSAWYVQNGRTPVWARWRWFGGACWLVAAFFYWVASTQLDLPRSPLFVPDRSQDMGRHLVYGLFAFFLILPAVFGRPRQGLVRRFLACRPMAYLGLISYGIYLWHTTVIDVVVEHSGSEPGTFDFLPFFLTVAAVTCAVSTVTYFLVERPCTALGRRWARWVRVHTRRGAGAGAGRGEGAPQLGGAGGVGGGGGVPAAAGGARGRELSGGGHVTVLGGAADDSPGDSPRTVPLRGVRPGATRSGDVPAARVPTSAVPGAPAPRAPVQESEGPSRWDPRRAGRRRRVR
ncbi:putative acyltransferase [Frankia sp. EI5c]|uniref:acyltransferase family protein n=1 Tax=Frankia sp. EI5c TaxID=683316 RepID=UPI0007C274AD|nr:acyltransferase [Frankia sp. EI5c]OAA23284.1 putative acyltransferase [Frankia sp. EI5c]